MLCFVFVNSMLYYIVLVCTLTFVFGHVILICSKAIPNIRLLDKKGYMGKRKKIRNLVCWFLIFTIVQSAFQAIIQPDYEATFNLVNQAAVFVLIWTEEYES